MVGFALGRRGLRLPLGLLLLLLRLALPRLVLLQERLLNNVAECFAARAPYLVVYAANDEAVRDDARHLFFDGRQGAAKVVAAPLTDALAQSIRVLGRAPALPQHAALIFHHRWLAADLLSLETAAVALQVVAAAAGPPEKAALQVAATPADYHQVTRVHLARLQGPRHADPSVCPAWRAAGRRVRAYLELRLCQAETSVYPSTAGLLQRRFSPRGCFLGELERASCPPPHSQLVLSSSFLALHCVISVFDKTTCITF